MTAVFRRRLRHPVAIVTAWSTAIACAGTPWLLEPPLWVRGLAALLAGLTTWAAVRAAGALATCVRGVLRGDAPRARFVAGLAVLLAIGGWTAAPAGTAEASTVAPAVLAPATIAVTERPLRVRVPLTAAATDAGRARIAVAELVRGGGLARSAVLVAVPTGSGWIDGPAVRQVERLTGGDVATVTVQYADRPSWVEYLTGRSHATRSAVAVLAAVRAELATLPADRRPRLLVFGESLGATAAAAAVRSEPVDGCLLAGRPGSADEPDVPGCLDVRNDDDPIPWWRPGLLVAPRPGLPWLPVATFWQVTGSLVAALDQPSGHGHRYGAGLAPAWSTLLGARTPRGDLISGGSPPAAVRPLA